MIQKLKETELQLVENSHQLRDLQARSTEGEGVLKNKIKALESENEDLWEDYKEASKQAERREAELGELMDHLKGSEAQLIAVFHRLCNVDEEMQNARARQPREWQLYDD